MGRGQLIRACAVIPAVWFAVLPFGCTQHLIDSTDRQVYELIRQRQVAALGETSEVDLGPEDGGIGSTASMYDTTPRPITPELPPGFASPAPSTSDNASDTAQAAEATIAAQGEVVDDPHTESAPDPAHDQAEADSQQAPVAADDDLPAMSHEIFTPDELDRVRIFKLSDALLYASDHARSLQDAKEDLYLAALDLTLERHLWTPQWVASLRGEFADFGQVREFDRAMTAVSDVSLSQRLPYGGEVSARIVNRLMRDLGEHVTSGETGDLILEANIPLFRGAGRVAYESRYQAERSMIYAVRRYQRFRRTFLVSIAGDYFNLQRVKAGLFNSYTSYMSRRDFLDFHGPKPPLPFCVGA